MTEDVTMFSSTATMSTEAMSVTHEHFTTIPDTSASCDKATGCETQTIAASMFSPKQLSNDVLLYIVAGLGAVIGLLLVVIIFLFIMVLSLVWRVRVRRLKRENQTLQIKQPVEEGELLIFLIQETNWRQHKVLQ